MGSYLVGIAFFVGILEVCFLYKVVWEECLCLGWEYSINFTYKVVWGGVYDSGCGMIFIFRTKLFGEMSTPRRRILLIFRIKSSSVVSTPRGSV